MDDGDVSCALSYTEEGRRIEGTADELRELYENAGSRKACACSRFARYNNLVHKIPAKPDRCTAFHGISRTSGIEKFICLRATLLYGIGR